MLLKIRLHCCIGVYADFNSQAPPPSIRRFTLVMDRQLSFTGLYTGAEEDVVDGKKHQRHDTVDELEADAGAVAKRSY